MGGRDGSDRRRGAALDQPTLAAGPFRLRPFSPLDLQLVREASSDPLIPLITTLPADCDDREGWAFIERQRGRATNGEGWSWAIARNDTDRAVGQVGLWPDRDGRASIGYWVVASERGGGASAHAVHAACRFAFDVAAMARLVLRIEPGNLASIRTAERAGFAFEGVLRGYQVIGGERRDLALYARLAPSGRAGPATAPRRSDPGASSPNTSGSAPGSSTQGAAG